MGGFATNDVSLSKLESFSDQSSFEQYLFLCDIVGHIEDPKVQKSLEELGFHTISLEILGVYPASPFRNLNFFILKLVGLNFIADIILLEVLEVNSA